MWFQRSAALIVGVSAFTAACLPAFAAEIYPTTIILERDRPIATLRIRNDAAKAKSYEFTGYRWRQENVDDNYTPDDTLIISPPIVTLAPQEEAVIRVGLLEPNKTGDREHAFRLLINDISAPKPTTGGLNLRLQILLPVFLKAATPNHALSLIAAKSDDGRLCIAGRNDGDTHAKMVWLDGAALKERIPTHQYFLAGASTEVCFDNLRPEDAAKGVKAGVTSAYQPGITEHEIQTRHSNAAVLRDKQ